MEPLTATSDLWSRLESLVREANGYDDGSRRELEENVAALRDLFRAQQLTLDKKTAHEDQLHARSEQLEHYFQNAAEQTRLYRDLFDYAPHAYLLTDRAGGITEANHNAAALLGVSRALLCNKLAPFFVVAEQRVELYRRLAYVHRGEDVIRNWEVRLQSRDGALHDTLMTVTVIFDADRVFQGLRWMIRDVTELSQARERAVRLERLAILGSRAAELAHDGRNLLGRAQGLLQRVAWRMEEHAEVAGFVKGAMDANDDLIRLFGDVCGYAGSLDLDPAPCNPAEIWRQAWQELIDSHPQRSAKLIERTQATGEICHADPGRLRQVFRNLFDNSWAACRGDVEVSIACWSALSASGSALCIAVRDNGPGLREEERCRLFEPFFTTKKNGTGLGLSISKRIVEAHGGRIEATPASSGGAEFLITLPRKHS